MRNDGFLKRSVGRRQYFLLKALHQLSLALHPIHLPLVCFWLWLHWARSHLPASCCCCCCFLLLAARAPARAVCLSEGGGGHMVTLNEHAHKHTSPCEQRGQWSCMHTHAHSHSLFLSQKRLVVLWDTHAHTLVDSWQPLLFCPCSCTLQPPSCWQVFYLLTHTQLGDNRSEMRAHTCTVRTGDLLRALRKIISSSGQNILTVRHCRRPAGQVTCWVE